MVGTDTEIKRESISFECLGLFLCLQSCLRDPSLKRCIDPDGIPFFGIRDLWDSFELIELIILYGLYGIKDFDHCS